MTTSMEWFRILGRLLEGVTASSTFDASQETVAKILKRHGYQTGMVGKWDLPANPGETGFDYFVYKPGRAVLTTTPIITSAIPAWAARWWKKRGMRDMSRTMLWTLRSKGSSSLRSRFS